MSLVKYYLFPSILERHGPYRIFQNKGSNRNCVEFAENNMSRFFPHVTKAK